MISPKANFGCLYSDYFPTRYVKHLIEGLGYELPFLAMERLKHYSRALLAEDIIRVTVVGSAHGLDAVALKHESTAQSILERWANETSVDLPFPPSESGYEVTLIDRESEPLRFAKDVNLSDNSFVADFSQPYSLSLQKHLAERTDIVTAIGATTYLGVEGMRRIIEAAFVHGNAKILCFPIFRYLESDIWVDLCTQYGLVVCKIGDLRQRAYKDLEEKQRIYKILSEKGILTEVDETGLITSLFLAYKKDIIMQNDCNTEVKKPRTLITAESENTFVGTMERGTSHSKTEWPHPWHIALSKEDSQNRTILRTLTEFHMQSLLQPGDVITAVKSSAVNNVEQWANMFAGEFEIDEQRLPDGFIKQTLIKTKSIINANILDEVPESADALETELRGSGHVLIRNGKEIDEDHVLKLLIGNGKAMDYRYGNVARKKVNNSASLQVTPWPKDLSILPHSELTYHTEFPRNMSFICKEPAPYGGETSIYDCAQAFENLSPNLQRKVKNQNVIFRKRYVQAADHGRYPSWQQVVGEDGTHEELIEDMEAMGYHCVVLQLEENGGMTTVVETQLTRPMAYEHQGRYCLHSSVVGIAPYWYQEVWPGAEPPLTVIWDNGEPFSFEELREMENALLFARIRYNNWQKNDVMILDNPRIAHGRLPFSGTRVIGALMAQPAQFTNANGQWSVELV